VVELRRELEILYRAYNRRTYVHPDPLELVYRYDSPQDQEIAGLVSACLAYGRVAQILASVGRLLDPMGSPRTFLLRASAREIRGLTRGFAHRFTTAAEAAALLGAIQGVLRSHGTLERLFVDGLQPHEETILPALTRFVERLRALAGGAARCASLLSSPDDGSACKRLNLYLRWMARRDAVDPGCWRGVPAAKLVVPLDTHLFRIAGKLGLTRRRQADLKTALEVTAGFRRLRPRDPVRYDFALTRFGIHPALRGHSVPMMETLLKGTA